MPFVKLDCKILDKSIWRESPEICKVWITILAMADSDGLVEASIIGISDRARLPINETEKAIEKFMLPDTYSTNPANEGRKVERVIGGFQVLNYEIYRQKDHTAAARMRKHRDVLRVTGVTLQRVYASASEVLNYLNLKTERKYRSFKNILPRLREGRTIDELKKVIDIKILDPYFIENPQYLNPETLFRPGNFDRYINQRPSDFKRKRSSSNAVSHNPTPISEPTIDERIQHLQGKLEQAIVCSTDRALDEKFRKQYLLSIPIYEQELADLTGEGE